MFYLCPFFRFFISFPRHFLLNKVLLQQGAIDYFQDQFNCLSTFLATLGLSFRWTYLLNTVFLISLIAQLTGVAFFPTDGRMFLYLYIGTLFVRKLGLIRSKEGSLNSHFFLLCIWAFSLEHYNVYKISFLTNEYLFGKPCGLVSSPTFFFPVVDIFTHFSLYMRYLMHLYLQIISILEKPNFYDLRLFINLLFGCRIMILEELFQKINGAVHIYTNYRYTFLSIIK